jgi:UDP-glucose 4-epimerase
LSVACRVLVTGLSSFWGGKLAQALERDASIETIIGVSPEDPTCELERTEYVRVGTQHALLRRIVQAAEIDTVVDSRLIVDSTTASAREAHEANVIGTMNILAACSGPDSPVRKFVFKSSAHYYGCEQDDPAFFTERMQRPHPPRTLIERDIVEAEKAVASFAERNRQVTVTTLRFVNGLGPTLRTGHASLLSLPAIPGILGFDPRYQFIHEDDIVGVLEHAVREELPGVYNASGDGVLVLSEIASLLGRPLLPLLPPWGTALATEPLRLVGRRVSPEMLRQLRFGRAVDNRKLKAAGVPLRHTTRETVQAYAEHLRVAAIRRGEAEPYRYEREVEEFLRYSPSVRRRAEQAAESSR